MKLYDLILRAVKRTAKICKLCHDKVESNVARRKNHLQIFFLVEISNNALELEARNLVCTRAAPKVMPPVYFHGNYNRYKAHNNTI